MKAGCSLEAEWFFSLSRTKVIRKESNAVVGEDKSLITVAFEHIFYVYLYFSDHWKKKKESILSV